MPETDSRFDHVVLQLLEHNNGVFLGERHRDPSLRQSLIKLLPLFKASGVGTVSLELPQNIVDEMSRMPTSNELNRRWPNQGLSSYFEVVKSAQKLGLRVLGHDTPWPRELENTLERSGRNDGAIEYAHFLWASSEEGMKERDTFAASHIQKSKSGKVIVLGGSSHSGNYTRRDMDDPDSLDSSGIPKGTEVRSQYQGLDAKLGIPSIDYCPAAHNGSVGSTTPTNGKFNTYEVFLPTDLGQLNSPSWPPQPLGGRNSSRTSPAK
jgi:hypothetical protein